MASEVASPQRSPEDSSDSIDQASSHRSEEEHNASIQGGDFVRIFTFATVHFAAMTGALLAGSMAVRAKD